MLIPRALIVAIGASLSICSTASAGIDDTQPPCEAFSRSAAVFVGVAGAPIKRTVKLPDEPPFELILTPIAVERTFLGPPLTVVYVAPSAVETRPTAGQKYLIYGGEYSVPGVVMASPGFGAKDIDAAADDLTFLESLPPSAKGGTIAGTIRLRQAASRADVRAARALGGISVKIIGKTYSTDAVTADDGTFVATDLPPGEYELRPILSGDLIAGDPTTRFTTRIRAGGCANTTIDVRTNGRIRGVVRGPDGLPLRSTTVDVIPADIAPDSVGHVQGMGSVSANEEGVFLFTGLAPGRYYLGVSLYNAPNPSGPSYPRTYYPGTNDRNNAVPIVVQEGTEVGSIDLAIPAILPKGDLTVVVAEEDAANLKLTLCVIQLEDLVKRRTVWEIRAGVPHVIPVVQGQRYEIHAHGEFDGGHLDAEPLVVTGTTESVTVTLRPDQPRSLH